jgi:hypothetical protein
MTFEEINLMPPLKMGRATCQWTIKALKHSNEPEPKSLSKLPSRWSQKSQVSFKCKGAKPNGTPRILMPLGGEQNRRDKHKR